MVYIDSGLDKYAGVKMFRLQSIPDACTAIGNGHPFHLHGTFSDLVNKAVSRATWAKYSSGFNAFCDFEKFTGSRCFWPLSREVWRSFIVW